MKKILQLYFIYFLGFLLSCQTPNYINKEINDKKPKLSTVSINKNKIEKHQIKLSINPNVFSTKASTGDFKAPKKIKDIEFINAILLVKNIDSEGNENFIIITEKTIPKDSSEVFNIIFDGISKGGPYYAKVRALDLDKNNITKENNTLNEKANISNNFVTILDNGIVYSDNSDSLKVTLDLQDAIGKINLNNNIGIFEGNKNISNEKLIISKSES